MKLFFTYLFSFVFLFNQISHSYTIAKKTNIYQYLKNCNDITKFENYYMCFYNNLKIKNPHIVGFNKSVKLKSNDKDLADLLDIAKLINVAIDNDIISNQSAIKEWSNILNSNYSKKIKKKKLKESIDESKCLNKSEFKTFINCFYKDFRNLSIYKESNIITKKRIETLMLNSIHLREDFVSNSEDLNLNIVILLDKNDQAQDAYIGADDGFTFFLRTINALGSDFYKKKDLDINYKQVLIFIAIVVIIALVAQGALSKSGVSSSSGNSASSASSTTTFKSSTSSNIVNKPWFKFAYRRGFY